VLFRVVERKWLYFLLSGLLIVPGVFFLAIGGLKPGIEFRGGSLLDVGFVTPPPATELHDFFASLNHPEATVQGEAGNRMVVRTIEMQPGELVTVQQALKEKYGSNLNDVSPSVVSPSFSAELIQPAATLA
jgi:preprotein translocase subunit SecF